jgi:hypothetical protein
MRSADTVKPVILDRIMVLLTIGFESDMQCGSGSDLRLETSACGGAGLASGHMHAR